MSVVADPEPDEEPELEPELEEVDEVPLDEGARFCGALTARAAKLARERVAFASVLKI